MVKEKYFEFNSEEDYQSFRKQLVEKSKEGPLSPESIDEIIIKYSGLEENELLRKDIISKMNEVYLSRKNFDQFYTLKSFVIAADYFLEYLIEGKYLDPESGKTEKADFSEDIVIERSLSALLYYVEHPFNFESISLDKKKKEIGKKLIEKFEKSNITIENRKNFLRICYILAGETGEGLMVLSENNQKWINQSKAKIIDFAKVEII